MCFPAPNEPCGDNGETGEREPDVEKETSERGLLRRRVAGYRAGLALKAQAEEEAEDCERGEETHDAVRPNSIHPADRDPVRRVQQVGALPAGHRREHTHPRSAARLRDYTATFGKSASAARTFSAG